MENSNVFHRPRPHSISGRLPVGAYIIHSRRSWGYHIFLTSHHMTRKTPKVLTCKTRKRTPYHGPERHHIETIWPWSKRNVITATVPNVYKLTWCERGVRKQEILTTVPTAIMPKQFDHRKKGNKSSAGSGHYHAEMTWPWNQRTRSPTTVQNADMRKASYRGDPRYIGTKAFAHHPTRTLASLSFYRSFISFLHPYGYTFS